MANVKQVQRATPTVMTGTGRQVIQLLHRSPAQRTVAVSLPNNEQGVAAEIVFNRVVEFLPQLIEQSQQDNLKKILSALLPDVAPSEAAMAQARMLIDAKSTILKSGDWPIFKERATGRGFRRAWVRGRRWLS